LEGRGIPYSDERRQLANALIDALWVMGQETKAAQVPSLHYSTVQYCTMCYTRVPYSTLQSFTIRQHYTALQYSTVLYCNVFMQSSVQYYHAY